MISTQEYYHSNGKLLITGEYLILKGALSLAVPTLPGQSLQVESYKESNTWKWTVMEQGRVVQEFILDRSLQILQSLNPSFSSDFLLRVWKELLTLNPDLQDTLPGLSFTSNLEFEFRHGLGSSSSLLNNLAQWGKVDPFELHFNSTNGSGYDVACAGAESPILYRLENDKKPNIQKATFYPPFRKNLYFVYLGQKQNSSLSVKEFLRKNKSYEYEANLISEITREMLQANRLDDFNHLLREHEQIVGSILRAKPIQQENFGRFEGQIKSLGAWGGDFALISWPHEKNELSAYLSAKNLKQLFSFDELIKSSE